jgi:hypothetical protein
MPGRMMVEGRGAPGRTIWSLTKVKNAFQFSRVIATLTEAMAQFNNGIPWARPLWQHANKLDEARPDPKRAFAAWRHQ